MGWGLAAAWLAVVGTTVLTFGTGLQARDSFAEFNACGRGFLFPPIP